MTIAACTRISLALTGAAVAVAAAGCVNVMSGAWEEGFQSEVRNVCGSVRTYGPLAPKFDPGREKADDPVGYARNFDAGAKAARRERERDPGGRFCNEFGAQANRTGVN
jgi:hypothetical protein